MNTAKNICFWMICTSNLATFDGHAMTVNYALDNLVLTDGEQIAGTFYWTYDVGDFEGGSGAFIGLDIPYTIYSFVDGNLNMDIQTNSIEISGNGNYHDVGLDITLKFLQPFTATQSASIDLGLSFFECCGNGFKDQPFQSGMVIPSTVFAGDFDTDGDVDGSDFLRLQREGVTSPPDASDLAAWKADFGAVALVSAVSVAVPEPRAVLLGVMAGLVGIHFRPYSRAMSDTLKRRRAGRQCLTRRNNVNAPRSE